ncbi:MAG: hypothetical protein CVT99_14475 [Bacteroidetes bacterium HGW-Bacteroidetes-16]|nr:MAG: hypothetical protein CVT99_14475 [Bacteroidetes bacterium HGW-Bacteroidetes-16]
MSIAGESSVVQLEGKRKVTRSIKLYNLDAIISVGFRVNSKRGIQFRIWTNRILKEYAPLSFECSDNEPAGQAGFRTPN